jgi:hypothetical protein
MFHCLVERERGRTPSQLKLLGKRIQTRPKKVPPLFEPGFIIRRSASALGSGEASHESGYRKKNFIREENSAGGRADPGSLPESDKVF